MWRSQREEGNPVIPEPLYKLSHLDEKKIMSAARQALIAADPEYHAWSPCLQERFRATMNETARCRIKCVLLNSLLETKCKPEEVDEIWNAIPISDLNQLNWAKLLTSGIGKDYIWLNEYMAEDTSLLNFRTLHDYDYADHVFQEDTNKKEFPGYQAADYYAFRHPSWVRLLVDGRFYYSNFTSLSTHVLDEIESAGHEILGRLIPHEYVDGEEHGKSAKGGVVWDRQIDAAGQEAQLNELKDRWYAYQRARWLELSKSYTIRPPTVYTHDNNWDNDPHRCFIFTNEETLKKIRWQHFLADCDPLMREYSVIEKILTKELDRANKWLTINHQDIQKNFDPTVVKLRKKRKIIMSDSALDDLRTLDVDDEPD